jgi:isopenicillin-N N-acyltransferase-like protein
MLRKIIKTAAWVILILAVTLAGLALYVRIVAIVHPPVPNSLSVLRDSVTEVSPGLFKIGNNWFRKSESGLYELYVEGAPFERGVINGRLTRALVQHQEVVFNKQIHQLVPSNLYLGLLKYIVGWFNRDLEKSVLPEYQLEILGISHSASAAFNDIAPPYQRILNYHAAHDIGHALQNVSLVGCTSFATWGAASEDSSLIIGRNFDFYLGDDFARDKIVAFYKPSDGHAFMMVTFGGMTGVLSGMNDQGLTVTINAAKSDVISASATPVSLVAREILQYAANVKEAYAIATKRKMFVAESFLIGSANDGKAVLIEKTPDAQDLVEPSGDFIISTNHFQGDPLGKTQLNEDHMRNSASPYRYARVKQLLEHQKKNSVLKTAAILRNRLGLEDGDIGLGNEKAINQLVAHHSVIFQPEKRRVWVSTAPWQLGKFVCYDLRKIFSLRMTTNREIYEPDRIIPADTFLLSADYRAYLKFSKFRFPFTPRTGLQPDSMITWNPHSYLSYLLAGDADLERREFAKAISAYQTGLTLEIATLPEREHMEKNLQRCKEKIK